MKRYTKDTQNCYTLKHNTQDTSNCYAIEKHPNIRNTSDVRWDGGEGGLVIGRYILITGGITDPFGDNTYATGYLRGVGTLTLVDGEDLHISQFYDGQSAMPNRRWNALETNLNPKHISMNIKGSFADGATEKSIVYKFNKNLFIWEGDYLGMWEDRPDENNRYELEIKFMI